VDKKSGRCVAFAGDAREAGALLILATCEEEPPVVPAAAAAGAAAEAAEEAAAGSTEHAARRAAADARVSPSPGADGIGSQTLKGAPARSVAHQAFEWMRTGEVTAPR